MLKNWPLIKIQSPLVIVDLLIVDSLIIVDRLSRPIVYFSMYFSRNSGFSCYSGQFAADWWIHHYKRRLYIITKKWQINLILKVIEPGTHGMTEKIGKPTWLFLAFIILTFLTFLFSILLMNGKIFFPKVKSCLSYFLIIY